MSEVKGWASIKAKINVGSYESIEFTVGVESNEFSPKVLAAKLDVQLTAIIKEYLDEVGKVGRDPGSLYLHYSKTNS